MRKLAVFCLAIILSTSSCFGWGFKKDKPDIEGRGYVGTLPDISKNFNTTDPKSTKPLFEDSKNFNSSEEIKPVPRDNPAFVNIILKDNKTSPYLNDINELLPQLENLLSCIEDRGSVQLFNAKAFFFTKTVEFLRNKGIIQSNLLKERGIGFVVHKANLEYKKSAKLDDLLRITTNIIESNGVILKMCQDIFLISREGKDIKADLLFHMNIDIVCINRDYKPIRIPKDINNLLFQI